MLQVRDFLDRCLDEKEASSVDGQKTKPAVWWFS